MVLGGPGSYFWQGMQDMPNNHVKIMKPKPRNVHSSVFLIAVSPLGQVISAAKENIIKAYYPGYFVQSVEGQIQTKQVQAYHDDSYQGRKD